MRMFNRWGQGHIFFRQICAAAAAFLFFATLVWGQLDLDRMRALALQRYGQDTASLVDEWYATIETMRSQPDELKLDTANKFFNQRIRWVQDPEAWGQKDYWATPLETMGKGMGDCEDFAIAKYAMLVLAGMDINKLRITYVKAQIGGPDSTIHAAHMVLAYYPEPSAVPDILDNLITDIYPASKRTDLTPVYGFNSRGLWVGGAATPATNNPGAKLSRWRDVLQRAANEGLG
ncbi:transglutaminase [Seongchinamella unica]|uniref:Transglutaminase n=1 Tax=Seongchinamella unica TaxID=2547392 RepID=A0A4R5LV76_9GAMM|nr:transglutaminase-like cysteine peptidase [Seongchinamella unica]TDG15247.1 transglutaminase [Seongchinamella unica]